jgi:signal transduction histidine kinase/CheY-like chemotaxis protein
LEEANRWTRDALELAVSLIDVQNHINPDQEPGPILTATRLHLKRLMGFRVLAFLTVDDADNDFIMADCDPDANRAVVQEEIDCFIADGTFAWTINQNHPVIVPTRYYGGHWILNALATRSRVVGLFIGVVTDDGPALTDITLNLLSIMLSTCANVLENSALYRKLNEQNKSLESVVQKRTEELSIALKKAEAASTAKSRFLANISHELRTPLNAVIGLAELLLDDTLTTEQREYVAAICSSGKDLLEIIDDLLDFSKIEAGRLKLRTTKFSLPDAVNDTVLLLAQRAKTKGLSLKVTIDPRVPGVLRGDRYRLRQILTNLIGNAIKFTERGGIGVEVRSHNDTERRVILRFAVTDTGIGISKEAVPMLFQPFSQIDMSPARRHAGTGLGLAVSKQLVELMRGEIGVTSELDKGSTFWFTTVFEKQRPFETSLSTPSHHPKEGYRLFRARQEHPILVADDNAVNQKVAARMLEKMGCKVDVVSNGREAIAAVEKAQYGMIFMDCQMPDLDGIEATREIRRLQGRKHLTVIIAMSANAVQGEEEKYLAAGMDDYICKPVTTAAFALMLEKWSVGEAATEQCAAKDVEPPRGRAIVDAARLAALRQLSDDPDFLPSLLALFLSETPGRLTELRRAICAQDPQTVQTVAHLQKGSCVNIGAEEMANRCQKLESLADLQQLSEAEVTLDSIEQAFADVSDVVQSQYLSQGAEQ